MYCAKCGKEIIGMNRGTTDLPICEECYDSNNQSLQPSVKAKKDSQKVLLTVNVILTAILICITSCFYVFSFVNKSENAREATKSYTEEERTIAKNTLKVSDVEIKNDKYSDKLYCDITNLSDKDLDSIRICVCCYDVLGNYIGSASLYESYLPANETVTLDSYAVDGTKKVEVYDVRADYMD